jgi:pimeloyl-ACP methyl ester carboxylesterase
MSDSDIQAAIAHWAPRFVTQGVDANDFRRVTASITRWDEWLDAWSDNGNLHTSLAEEAASLGRTLTAGQAWMRAALSYHFAKFVWVLDMEKHRIATDKSVNAMRRAHKFLDPSAERIHIPFDGARLVGNLRRPANSTRPNLVILLPGLDSTKEEFFNWENVFLHRGLATFSLDGPGQGESGYSMSLRHDYEIATTATIDALSYREDLNIDRLGIAGVSMGGYYAARSAAQDHRIRAVVTVGGPYDVGSGFAARPEISRAAFTKYSGATSFEEAQIIANKLTLEPVIGNLVAPMLVIFGRMDRLVPYQQAERVVAEAAHARLVMFEEGNHVCNNLPYRYQPLAGDWMAEQLSGQRWW